MSNKFAKHLTKFEFAYITPLAILIIIMGVFPNFFLDKIKPSLNHLARNFQNYRLVSSTNSNTKHSRFIVMNNSDKIAESSSKGADH